MKKTLLLVRHAKAEAEAHGQNDFDRELTGTGMSQSYEMGKMLAAESITIQLIITSPANRTKATAETLAQLTGYAIEKIELTDEAYNASARTLMDIVHKTPEEIESMILVAHNPGISYVSEYLTHDQIGDMPTCGMVKN